MRFTFFSTLTVAAFLVAQEMVRAVNLSTQGTQVDEEQFYDTFAEQLETQSMSQPGLADHLSQIYLEDEEDSKAQVSTYNYADFLTQINAEIETAAQGEEQSKEESLAVFSNYLAQIGDTDVHSVLAQLASELGSDHVQMLTTVNKFDDDNLAQATAEEEYPEDNNFAQIGMGGVIDVLKKQQQQQSEQESSSEESDHDNAPSSVMSSIPDTESYTVDDTDDIDSLDCAQLAASTSKDNLHTFTEIDAVKSAQGADEDADLAAQIESEEIDLGGFMAEIDTEDLGGVTSQRRR